MSTVSYDVSFTRNMGNFESMKVSIGVEDSPRGEETTSQAYNRVKGFVEERLIDEVEAIEATIRKARGE